MMNNTPLVSIVILNWNGENQLNKYLPSVLKFTNASDYEIVVVDNGSTDNSVQLIKDDYPSIRLICFEENYGFAGGYQKALEIIQAKYYVLLNSDVRVSEGWLDHLVKRAENNPEISAIQPKILSDRDSEYFEHAGAAGGMIDKYAYPFCRGRIMATIEKDKGQYNHSCDIFWASGAALFIRSEAYHQAGGLDPRFFAHMEEIDLCWRLNNLGHRIVYEPQSTVYHWGGATLDYNNPRKLYLNFRNSLITLYKNSTSNHPTIVLAMRFAIDTVAGIKFFLTFDLKSLKALYRAHQDFLKMRPELKREREELHQNIIKKKHSTILNGSIVFQYFAFSIRKFSQIKQLNRKQ